MKSKTTAKITRTIKYLPAILMLWFFLNSMISETMAKSISVKNNSLDVPTELSVEQEDGVVTLSWTNNGGTGKNLIERRTAKESWKQIGSVEAEEESFADESIEADGTYFYRVRNANEKAYSNEVSISVKANAEEETEPETQPTTNKPQNPTPNPSQEWKKPKFRFEVEIPELNSTIMVEEIAGLNTEEPIEYRGGNSPNSSVQKMPGIKKFGNITLKKGMFKEPDVFWKLYEQVKSTKVQGRTTIIKLLDEDGNPTMVWTLTNAFPSKIIGTDSKSEITINFEYMTIHNKEKD